MAYNLPMQIALQNPSAGNIASVKKSIESALGGMKVEFLDAKGLAKANAAINNVGKTLDKNAAKAKNFVDTLEGKTISVAAYALVSTAIYKVTGAISQATREAIRYEKELIGIAQTTDESVKATFQQSKALSEISVKYNVALSKVASLTRILAQTGMNFRESAKAAELLARTSLLASFDNLQDTTEGLVAVMQTFNMTATQSASVLEKINIVAKRFAVESGDIVEAIRRSGGAFKAAGGDIEELIALFTSVRSTTRESAETISTGFRTIFARLERPKTIEYFKQLGIQLEDANGQFIGPLKAIEAISAGLERLGIRAGSIKFAEVVEEIGGIRQLSRVIPLLEQLDKTREALRLQDQAAGESAKDLAKAQQGLGYQLGVLHKEFTVLISDIVNSKSMKFLVDIFINLSRAVLQVVGAFKPLLPILTFMAAWKGSTMLGQLMKGGINLKGLQGITGMARGGLVPGSGNGDTVPAMLTPGEFVVRKSAVQAFGAGRLAGINKYAEGGYVKQSKRGINNQTLSWGDIDNEKEISSAAKGSIKGVIFERLLRKRLGRSEGTNVYPDFPNLKPKEKLILGIAGPYKNAEAKLHKSGGKPTNDTAIVYAFAKGGAVGTDTVPAMLTPGEFVVNKRSAQAYGYANLKRINKYAKGGTVGDIERGTGEVIKNWKDITDELRAVMLPGAKAISDGLKNITIDFVKFAKSSTRGGFKGTEENGVRGGMIGIAKGKATQSTVAHEAGHAIDWKLGKGEKMSSQIEGTFQNQLAALSKAQIETALKAAGASEKDLEYRLKSEELFADFFQKSDPAVREIIVSTIDAEEGMKKLADLFNTYPDQYKRLYGDVQVHLEAVSKATAAQAASAEAAAAAAGGTGATNPFASMTGTMGKAAGGTGLKPSKGEEPAKQQEKITKSAEKLGLSFVELATKAQIAVSALKTFAGLDVNQAALTTATTKGSMLSTAGGVAQSFADPGTIKAFGAGLRLASNKLGSLGGPVKALGNTLFKNSGTIAAGAAKAAKALNILSIVELGGGLLDALFSTDYGKQRDQFIELGDSANAAAAAAKAYAQEGWRSIPILGGFIAAIGAGSQASQSDLDATGQLAVENARLAAGINGLSKEVDKGKRAFSEAQMLGDQKGMQEAIASQISAVKNVQGLGAINAQKAEAVKASGAATFGSTAGVLGGAAGGALIGATVGSVVPIIGTALGAVGGAIAGGVAGWWKSSKYAKQQIIKSYQYQADGIKEGTKTLINFTEQLGETMQTEAAKAGKHGLSFKDAMDNVAQQFGQANMDELTSGLTAVNGGPSFKMTGDPKKDVASLREISKARAEEARDIQIQINQLKDSETVKKAELEASLANAEGIQQRADALATEWIKSQAAYEAEQKLRKEREIQSRVIDEQIQAMKAWNEAMDKANNASRKVNEIREEAQNIGTGKLTFKKAATAAGLDSNVLQMSTDEIMRNKEARDTMSKSVSAMGGPVIEKQMQDMESNLSNFERITANKDLLGEIATTQYDTGEGKESQRMQGARDLLAKSGVPEAEINDALLNATMEFVGQIQEGGAIAAGKAEEEARARLTEQQRQYIEENKEKLKEYVAMEQEYRDMQIEQISRQQKLAQDVYDLEKGYFEERLALTNKVSDALEIEPRGKGRVGFLADKGQRQADAQRSALLKRRNAQFAAIGLGGQTRTEAVGQVSNGIANLNKAAGDAGLEMTKLKGQAEALINTIRDEINIEQEYLDSLIETAKAQQEYTQALNDAQGAIVRDLVTGTDEEVANQLSTMNAAALAASQGSFQGIPENMKKDIFNLFDQFADVEIPGLGKTGRDAQREITKNEMMRRFGVDAATAEKMASKAVQDRVPIDQKMAEQIKAQEQKVLALLEEEKQMKMALQEIDRQNNEAFGREVNNFREAVNEFREKIGLKPIVPAAGPAAAAVGANQAPPQVVQVQTNGQQQITIDIPGLQAVVNGNVTQLINEAIGQHFSNLAEQVRTANNFEDVANTLQAGATSIQTREMTQQV